MQCPREWYLNSWSYFMSSRAVYHCRPVVLKVLHIDPLSSPQEGVDFWWRVHCMRQDTSDCLIFNATSTTWNWPCFDQKTTTGLRGRWGGNGFTPQLLYKSPVICTVECVMSTDAVAMVITLHWMTERRLQTWILWNRAKAPYITIPWISLACWKTT